MLVFLLLLGAGRSRGELEIVAVTAPTTLHPLYAWTPDDRRIAAAVHAWLAEPGADGRWQSRIASLEVQGDDVVVTLDRGARWHDGQKVSAADVCATVTRLVDGDRPTAFTAPARARLAGCRADAATARVTVRASTPDRLAALAFPLLPAHRPDWLAAGPREAAGLEPIGAGPYRASQRASRWILQAQGGGSAVRRVTWTADADPVEAYLRGAGHLILDASPARLTDLRQADTVLWVERPGVAWSIALNPTRPPLDDPRVREALDLLIDRQALAAAAVGIEVGLGTTGLEPTSGPFPTTSELSSHGIGVPRRDEATAAGLLEATGLVRRDGRWHHDGEPWTVTMVLPTGQGLDPEALERALEAQWEGIDVLVRPLDATQWWHSLLAGGHADSTDAALVARATWPDPDPAPWFESRTEGTGWYNVFSVADPEADAALAVFHATTGTARRAAAHRLHAHLADQRSHLFLWEEAPRVGVRASLTPLVPDGPLLSRLDAWRLTP